jgi:hypothetical protein
MKSQSLSILDDEGIQLLAQFGQVYARPNFGVFTYFRGRGCCVKMRLTSDGVSEAKIFA